VRERVYGQLDGDDHDEAAMSGLGKPFDRRAGVNGG